MRRITTSELHELGVKSLGLDPSCLDLTSVECIAGALRRAAGFLCPCSDTALAEEVMQPLQNLVTDAQQVRELIDATLEALVTYGDLVESRGAAREGMANSETLLYVVPPGFVPRKDGSVFLLGSAPDHLSPLPDEVARRIEYEGHVRRIVPPTGEDLKSYLSQVGFFELSMEQWLKTPPAATPEHYLLRFNEALDRASLAGSIPQLRLLDASKPVRYDPARWTELRRQTGRFVARRPQAYGAELWSYAEVAEGHVRRVVDLPLFETKWRACDEARRLQAAIDARRGSPQQYRVRPGPTRETSVLDIFSPVPLWAQRRWDYTGRLLPRSGSLFSYVLPEAALEEEINFVKERLWLIDAREAG